MLGSTSQATHRRPLPLPAPGAAGLVDVPAVLLAVVRLPAAPPVQVLAELHNRSRDQSLCSRPSTGGSLIMSPPTPADRPPGGRPGYSILDYIGILSLDMPR